MIEQQLKRNPPSLYYVGETVLVCIAKTKKTVKGKKTTLRGTCEGQILKADHDLYRYYVDLEDPNTAKLTTWHHWQKKKRNEGKILQRNRTTWKHLSPDNCTSTPSNSKHVKLRNDESLPDASITKVLSFEQLKGDTINLNFGFLRHRSLSKQKNVSGKFLLLSLSW